MYLHHRLQPKNQRVIVQLLSCIQLFCDPVDCNRPVSSVHGISQARTLEWVVISSSGDLPTSGLKPASPALAADSLPPSHLGRPVKKRYRWVGRVQVWEKGEQSLILNWLLLQPACTFLPVWPWPDCFLSSFFFALASYENLVSAHVCSDWHKSRI